jgi:lipid A 3-O-deacylase
MSHIPFFRTLLSSLATASLCCFGPARADEATLHFGGGNAYRHTMAAYEFGPLYHTKLFERSLEIALEASLGRSLPPSGSAYGGLWHAGMTPLIRFPLTPATSLEYGLGANFFSGASLGDKEISTHFQFGNSLGILHHFAGTRWSTGLRFIHYSNAGLDTPNPGQDYLHLRIGYSFK